MVGPVEGLGSRSEVKLNLNHEFAGAVGLLLSFLLFQGLPHGHGLPTHPRMRTLSPQFGVVVSL